MNGNLFPSRVKVCGITNVDDALAAVDAGVQTLGFVFHPSSQRYIEPDAAREIISALPPQVVCVGVFVDQPPHSVQAVVDTCALTAVQWHGGEPDGWLRQVSVPAIRALRLRSQADLNLLADYPSAAVFLLDAWSAHSAGGTGKVWDWGLAAHLPRLDRPLALAGGLTPENVGQAIRRVHPAAVDVSSGVETAPGRKDYAKLRRFVAAAKEAFDAEST